MSSEGNTKIELGMVLVSSCLAKVKLASIANMLESGTATRCMEMVTIFTQMEVNTKEISSKANSMALECFGGQSIQVKVTIKKITIKESG